MSTKQKTYSNEFKEEAVKRVISGIPASQVARELDININSLFSFKESNRRGGAGQAQHSPKSISYTSQRRRTSSSVKPTYGANCPGFSIEYSVNILSAECVPYFLTGRIPVI